MKRLSIGICIAYALSWSVAYSNTTHKKIGNFANKITPTDSFAIGQNIYDAHTFFANPTMSQQSASDSSLISITAAAIYAFTDLFSVYAGLPVILKQKNDDYTQRGIGNFFVQFEYAPLLHTAADSSYSMITVLANAALPTTHLSTTYDILSTCSTASSSAAASFFVGATASHMSPRWYLSASTGAQCYTKKDHVRQGAQFLYEWGLGINIGNPWGLTAASIIEFNGIYSRKDSSTSQNTSATGGNILYVGPSICISGNHILFGGGIQLPVVQNLNGIQPKTHFRSALQLLVQFN